MPRRRRPPNKPLRTAIAVLVAVALCYALVMAYWQSGVRYSFAAVLQARLMDLLVAAWLFWVGSSVGSFLNVVAWRMPRGRSIGGRSHCPYCDVQLKGRDNIPVFGWLMLRGRCRSCRLPISPRYPIVELACGIMFMLFAYPELWRGGVNLPWQHLQAAPPGPVSMPWITPLLIALVVYHAVALANLMAIGLIRSNAAAVPSAWMAWSLAAAALPLFLLPELRVISWRIYEAGAPQDGLLGTVAHIFSALAAAGVMGRLLGRRLFPEADPKLRPLTGDTRRLIDLIAGLSIVGIVLGWQPLLAVLPLTLLAALLLRRFWSPPDALGLVLICLAPVTAFYIAFWDLLDRIPLLPGTARPPWSAFAAAAVAALLVRFFRPQAGGGEGDVGGASGQPASQEPATGEEGD